MTAKPMLAEAISVLAPFFEKLCNRNIFKSAIVIWHGILLPIIWDNFQKNVLILGAGGQIARHVINQLANKQTIKQTLFARQPAKSQTLSN